MKPTRIFNMPIHRRNQAGVTLIEIMVALLVLSIGLLGLAALQAFSLQANQGAYHRTQAVNVSYEVADFLRANRGDPGNVSMAFWEQRVGEQLPNGDINVALNAAAGTAVISVTWNDDRLGDEPDGGESVVVTARL